MSAPAFALTGLGDSGLHGLIPEPQREYALRKFTASGFGDGEVSWERQEKIPQRREQIKTLSIKFGWSTTSSATDFQQAHDSTCFLPWLGRSSWGKISKNQQTATDSGLATE